MASETPGDEVTIVRIYIHEADHGLHKPLMEEILDLLQKQHEVRGVTVFRGIAGLDAHGQSRFSDLLRLMVDLPLAVEFFDTPAKIETVLAAIDGLVPAGRILCWQAVCR
jgi:uncharacterized protein